MQPSYHLHLEKEFTNETSVTNKQIFENGSGCLHRQDKTKGMQDGHTNLYKLFKM